MHELGLVFQMAKVVEEALSAEEDITAIDTVVMEIGEISSVVPHYFEACFPAAADRCPLFEGAKLVIETIPAVARCRSCGKEFPVVENKGYCPDCGSFDKDLLSGREFNIKEVTVR